MPRAGKPPKSLRVLIVAFGLCLALAACGGSSNANFTSAQASQRHREQQMVKFAKCLREHGVDAETNTGPNGQGFNMRITGGPKGAGESGPRNGPPPQIEAAMNACKKYRPAPPEENLSPAEKAKQAQDALKFARCMRSHGVDVPDPGSSGVIEPQKIDPESHTFQDAQNACRSVMGKLPLRIGFHASSPGGPGQSAGSESVQAPAPGG